MTNEEAIQWIKQHHDTEMVKCQDSEAMRMAIAALERSQWIDRGVYLLGAAYRLLEKQDQNPFVVNILEETVFYDGAECDGSCLMDDIEILFEEAEIVVPDFMEEKT